MDPQGSPTRDTGDNPVKTDNSRLSYDTVTITRIDLENALDRTHYRRHRECTDCEHGQDAVFHKEVCQFCHEPDAHHQFHPFIEVIWEALSGEDHP